MSTPGLRRQWVSGLPPHECVRVLVLLLAGTPDSQALGLREGGLRPACYVGSPATPVLVRQSPGPPGTSKRDGRTEPRTRWWRRSTTWVIGAVTCSHTEPVKPPDEGRGDSPPGEGAARSSHQARDERDFRVRWRQAGAGSSKSCVSEAGDLRDMPLDSWPRVTAQPPVPLLEVLTVRYPTKGSDMHKKPT